MTLFIKETPDGLIFKVRVQPRSFRNQVSGLYGDALKINLTAPPVDGAANKACRMFIAKLCNIPRSQVLLIAGETSRHKRLLLEGANIKRINALFKDLLGG